MRAFLLLLAVVTGPPQSATVDAELSFDEHEPKIISASLEVPEGWSVLYDWQIQKPVGYKEIDGGRQVVVDGPPGTYELKASAILAQYDEVAKRVVFDKQVWTVQLVITSKGPRPPPDKPDPTTGRLESVLILRSPDDSVKERLNLQAIRQSPTFQTGTPRLLILDRKAETPDGTPDPIAAKFAKLIPAAAGSPYFFALDGEAETIKSGEVDGDFMATIDELLR